MSGALPPTRNAFASLKHFDLPTLGEAKQNACPNLHLPRVGRSANEVSRVGGHA
jgi:hypothetical protein